MPRCSESLASQNKATVKAALTELFIDKKPAAINKYWAEPYLQHNPIAKSGVAAFSSIMTSLVTSASFKYEILGIFAECDLVAVVGKYSQTGIIVDMFRLKENKIMEHWDSDTNTSAWETKFESTSKPSISELRETIEALYSQSLVPYIPELIADYFYARHIINNGASPSLAEYIATNKIRHEKIHYLIADGNFVFVLSQAKINDKAFALYEIFKMPFGNTVEITEYWSTRRAVPASTASGLSIF